MNRLAAETSPYLLQHAENPVDWRAWGPKSLAEAAAANKPILLSIGYAACHWCHVMAHESFEDPAIAALMNELFIPIKLDREERPDLDAIYQQALSMMGQQGGWPLTMFLTPKAQPFWGGTYFPPEPRWGRPGFPQILRAVSNAYARGESSIISNIKALADGLAHLSAPRAGGEIDPALLDRAAERLLQEIDAADGGFGGAPKFPQCSALSLIWRGYLRGGSAEMRDAVLLTLDRMSMGGIYDHLGGGFSRYATDDAWLVPHFEKMLYDNAQLIELLCDAFVETGHQRYQMRVEETIGWLLREMRQPEGGFAAALDADSEHEEGKFYVWTEAEIDQVLGEESQFFKAHYDVGPEGNWEGKIILNRLEAPLWLNGEGEQRLAAARERLLERRSIRMRPMLDHKILADWNGLTIAALARAGMLFSRQEWVLQAKETFEFIVLRMQVVDGRLLHSWCGGRTHPGNLDDHAQMSRAAIVLAQITGDAAYFDHARRWIAVLNRHFLAENGAFYFAADDTADLVARLCTAQDGAVPSGNGIMVEVFADLFHLTGEPAWADQAAALIRSLSGEISRSVFGLASFLNGFDQLLNARQVIAMPHAPDGLWRHISMTDLVSIVGYNGPVYGPEHPANRLTWSGDLVSLHVCTHQTCSLAFTDPAALRRRAWS